jgi:hypothetical protein
MPSFILYYVSLAALLQGVLAVKLYGNTTLPTDITTECSSALLADINCDVAVTYLYPEGYFSQDLLEKSCTDGCSQALATFETNVVKACASQTFGGEENWDLTKNPVYPVAMIPNKLRFNYGLSCLKDSGRFCNLVAAEAAAETDQDGGMLGMKSHNHPP